MIRIILSTQCTAVASHIDGGKVEHRYNTFDVELPDVEKYINEHNGQYQHTEVVGLEIVKKGDSQ